MNEQKAKATPGPWCVESVNSEALHDICLDYPVHGAGSPILIATVYDDDEEGPGRVSTFEAEANARLIAAAPDLLAALKAAEWVMRSHIMPEHFDGHASSALAEVRAAVAKAEGGG